jgi:Ethylbenzene dehydrogenase
MKKIFMAGAIAALAAFAAACGSGNSDKTPTPAATSTTVATAQPTATTAAASENETPMSEGTAGMNSDEMHHGPTIHVAAARASITVDGNDADWKDVEGVTVPLAQIEIPSEADWDKPGSLTDVDATLKVASDANNIYVLVEVPGDYDFNPDDLHHSPSVAVMFRMDDAAGPHMGATDEDLQAGLGMVDIWHWELGCGPGVVSGGNPASGTDTKCHFNDEYATAPKERDADGKGDKANAAAENSLVGAWDHTGRSQGAGAKGTWVFEMSRPLQTGDPQDVQLASPGAAAMGVAYWDPNETPDGWTEDGHLQSAENGWIELTLS